MNAADFPQVRFVEALELLAAMPGFVQGAIECTSADGIAFKPSPEAFSLLEHACHLRDLEREGYLVRLRRLCAEALPVLPGFDGDTIARERHYLAQDAHAAAAEFAAARAELLSRLRALTAADLAREGEFAGRRICVTDLVAMVVEHDRGHREEITRLMAERGA
jgi:hypothetical protein